MFTSKPLYDPNLVDMIIPYADQQAFNLFIESLEEEDSKISYDDAFDIFQLLSVEFDLDHIHALEDYVFPNDQYVHNATIISASYHQGNIENLEAYAHVLTTALENLGYRLINIDIEYVNPARIGSDLAPYWLVVMEVVKLA